MGCLSVLLDEREYLGHFTQDDVEYLISVAVVFVEEILDEQALGDGFHEDGQAARLYANAVIAFVALGCNFILGGGGAGEFNMDPIFKPGEVDAHFIGCHVARRSLRILCPSLCHGR